MRQEHRATRLAAAEMTNPSEHKVRISPSFCIEALPLSRPDEAQAFIQSVQQILDQAAFGLSGISVEYKMGGSASPTITIVTFIHTDFLRVKRGLKQLVAAEQEKLKAQLGPNLAMPDRYRILMTSNSQLDTSLNPVSNVWRQRRSDFLSRQLVGTAEVMNNGKTLRFESKEYEAFLPFISTLADILKTQPGLSMDEKVAVTDRLLEGGARRPALALVHRPEDAKPLVI